MKLIAAVEELDGLLEADGDEDAEDDDDEVGEDSRRVMVPWCGGWMSIMEVAPFICRRDIKGGRLVVGEGAAGEVVAVGGAGEDGAGDGVEEVDAHVDAIDRLDVGGEQGFVLGEVGRRHGIEVGRWCGIAHVEGALGVGEAFFEAFEGEGGVLEVIEGGEGEVVLEDDAVEEVDLAGGEEGDGGVEFGGVPDGDGGSRGCGDGGDRWRPAAGVRICQCGAR